MKLKKRIKNFIQSIGIEETTFVFTDFGDCVIVGDKELVEKLRKYYTPPQPETLTKEVLKDITNPENKNTVFDILMKYIGSGYKAKDCENEINKLEFDLSKKEYTLENMKACFYSSRIFMKPHEHSFKDFEEYINSLKQ